MLKITALIAAFSALALPASAETVYNVFSSTDPSCEIGIGGEGNIAVDGDTIYATETEYRLSGEKKDVADGFTEAVYDVMAEGEAYGQETLQLRVTDTVITLRGGGSELVGYLCE